MSAAATERPGRYLPLDVVRGLAILLTLCHQTQGLEALPGGLGWSLRQVQRVGWIGVDLFFVLSGFLIGGLLFSEWRRSGQLDLVRFYLRRWFRLYPPYLALLAFVVAGHFLTGRHAAAFWEQVLVQVFYLQNYLRDLSMFGHTWSLAVEEHFYLGLPLLLLLLSLRRGRPDPFRPLLVIVPLVAVATVIARCGLAWPALPADMGDIMHPTHLRIDALLWGVLLGYFWHLHPVRLESVVRHYRGLLTGATILLLLPLGWLAFYDSQYMCTLGLSVNAVGYALILALLLYPREGHRPAPPRPASRWLAAIGVASYSTYVWHRLVGTLWERLAAHLVPHWQATTGGVLLFNAAYLALALAVGHASARWLEVPLLAWRNRHFPSRGGRIAPDPSPGGTHLAEAAG